MENKQSVAYSNMESNSFANDAIPEISTETPSFTNGMTNYFTFTNILIFLLVLSLLGFNIYAYLAKGTMTFLEFFQYTVARIFGLFSQTASVSAEGASASLEVADVGLDNIKKSVDLPGEEVDGEKEKEGPNPQEREDADVNPLTNKRETGEDYEASEATSKVGWCFVGEDRGYRSCAEVGASDKCMSGDIFPSKEICVNPSLRA
jgi:hypothetical protein